MNLRVSNAEKKRGRSIYTLTEIAEDTGLDPSTAAQVMERLEDGGPYAVEAADAAYAERQWHLRGSAIPSSTRTVGEKSDEEFYSPTQKFAI